MLARSLRIAALALPLPLLGGCGLVVMNPSGDVARQQADLILKSTGLMLLIIVPVIVATLVFAWRYRSSNLYSVYDPDWHHSTRLEVLIWTAPLMIIIALGAMTWLYTHLLDPYRPIERIDANRPVDASVQPLEVEVVALDWKWMFFYPQYNIATINELAAPVDRPINFRLTSGAIMNSFYVPALAGMIYAMPGMETKLHAVINREGVYDGFSANYSGPGFSNMHFKFHGLSAANFDGWVEKVRAGGTPMNRDAFLKADQPSEAHPITYYSTVEAGLYQRILGMCVEPGKMCAQEMMHIDHQGGAGVESQANRDRLVYDGGRTHGDAGHGPSGYFQPGAGEASPGATFPASGREPRSPEQPQGMRPNDAAPEVDEGAPGGGSEHQGHGTSDPRATDQSSPAPAQINP